MRTPSMKIYALPAFIFILYSCASTPSDDPDSMNFQIPAGSTLSLNKAVNITEGNTHVFMQNNQLSTQNKVNRYDINCRLDFREFGPRTIEPEVFKITRTEDSQEWFSYPNIKRYWTTVYLASDKDTDVIKLDCEYWGGEIDRNFTVTEMQQSLGELMTFTFPSNSSDKGATNQGAK